MTTQTLRGMEHDGPMHWRGDRSGGGFSSRVPSWDGDPNALDENQAFLKFNVAFVGLLGRANQLSPADMQTFADLRAAAAAAAEPDPQPRRHARPRLRRPGATFFAGPPSDCCEQELLGVPHARSRDRRVRHERA